MTKILLGVTGSVAAGLTHKIVDKLPGEIHLILTEKSKYFIDDLQAIKRFEDVSVYDDNSEWVDYYHKMIQFHM